MVNQKAKTSALEKKVNKKEANRQKTPFGTLNISKGDDADEMAQTKNNLKAPISPKDKSRYDKSLFPEVAETPIPDIWVQQRIANKHINISPPNFERSIDSTTDLVSPLHPIIRTNNQSINNQSLNHSVSFASIVSKNNIDDSKKVFLVAK